MRLTKNMDRINHTPRGQLSCDKKVNEAEEEWLSVERARRDICIKDKRFLENYKNVTTKLDLLIQRKLFKNIGNVTKTSSLSQICWPGKVQLRMSGNGTTNSLIQW